MLYAARWTDGQVDMTKLIVTFPNFANAPINSVSASQTEQPVTITKRNPVKLVTNIKRDNWEIYVKYVAVLYGTERGAFSYHSALND